jgi:hypothetical protein
MDPTRKAEMNRDKITKLYDRFLIDGFINQLGMQSEILSMMFEEYNGDAIEIGARLGKTTVELLKVAKKFDRNIVVIDPWSGDQEGGKKEFEKFKTNTRKYNNLIVHRMRSQDALDVLSGIQYCYCFIDGLHTFEGCKTDLLNVYKTISVGGVVCVDDTQYTSYKGGGPHRALKEVLTSTGFKIIHKPFGRYKLKHKDFEYIMKCS